MGNTEEFDWSELLPDFIESAKENMEAVSSGLLRLEENGGNREVLEEIYRHAHSLKGSSLTIGFKKMGTLAHAMEDILRDFWEQKKKPTSEALKVLHRTLDQIERLLQEVAEGGQERSDISKILEQLKRCATATPPSDQDVTSRPSPEGAQGAPSVPKLTFSTLRVPARELDTLLNLVNEVLISRDRLHKKVVELSYALQKKNSHEVPQELVPELEKECDKDRVRLKEIQERILGIRMLPFSVIMNLLKRKALDLAQQFQKEIEFEVQGAETRVDKSILEELIDPLIHLMRNCIDHGIEAPEERKKKGKAPHGLVRLAAYQQGGRVTVEVADDGRGIDLQKVRAKALEKGLIKEEALPNLTDNDLLNFIFLPGFSTCTVVTDISGRGIGLDVVKNNIEKCKGNVEVTTKENQGTKFTLSFPLTLMTDRAVLLRVAGRTWAIPSSFVERLLRFSQDDVRVVNNQRALLLNERLVPVIAMGSVLGYGDGRSPSHKKWLQVVIVNSNHQRVAFEVEELLGDQEIIVKSLGSHLKRIDKIAGATFFSGQIVLIIDVPHLVRSVTWDEAKAGTVEEQAGKEQATEEKPRVLVVEDQLTTQQLEKSILEAAGFQVDTARDGVEAVTKLASKSYDVVVTDIKMPNMDGISLTRYVKSNDRYRHIPVIIVSAMEKEEDKKRGMQVGADAYIVKSKFEQGNLIDTVRQFIS